MTDHDLDRIAYEKCGYKWLQPVGTRWFEHARNPDTSRAEIGRMLEPWSNTDAAIAHAERAGFMLSLDNLNGTWRCGVLPRTAVNQGASSGESNNPGLAIRNAIGNLAQKGAE